MNTPHQPPPPHDDERISAYLDDELSAPERAEFERLIAESDAVRSAVDDLRNLSKSLRELPKQQLSGDLTGNILRRAERVMLTTSSVETVVMPREEPPKLRSITRRHIGWSLAMTAAAILILLAFPPWVRRDELARSDHDDVTRDTPTSTAETPDRAFDVADEDLADEVDSEVVSTGDLRSLPSGGSNGSSAAPSDVEFESPLPTIESESASVQDATIAGSPRKSARVQAPSAIMSRESHSAASKPTETIVPVTAAAVVNWDHRSFQQTLLSNQIAIEPATASRMPTAVQAGKSRATGESTEERLGDEWDASTNSRIADDVVLMDATDVYLVQSDAVTMRRMILQIQSQQGEFQPLPTATNSAIAVTDTFERWFAPNKLADNASSPKLDADAIEGAVDRKVTDGGSGGAAYSEASPNSLPGGRMPASSSIEPSQFGRQFFVGQAAGNKDTEFSESRNRRTISKDEDQVQMLFIVPRVSASQPLESSLQP